MKFFVLLNLGILIFSRSSGALLVMVGPALRQRVRSSLYRYLQGHSQRYFMGNFAGSLSNRVSEVSMGVNHSLWTVLFDFWPVTVTPGGFAGPARSGSFRSRSGAGFLDAGIRHRFLRARDALPGVREGRLQPREAR